MSHVRAASRATPRARCIRVTYDGSLPAPVRLHGTTTGSGLDQYLDLKVTRGAYNPTRAGLQVVHELPGRRHELHRRGQRRDLQRDAPGFPDDYASGLVDPLARLAGELDRRGEVHVYRFDVTLQSNFAAQNKNADADLHAGRRGTSEPASASRHAVALAVALLGAGGPGGRSRPSSRRSRTPATRSRPPRSSRARSRWPAAPTPATRRQPRDRGRLPARLRDRQGHGNREGVARTSTHGRGPVEADGHPDRAPGRQHPVVHARPASSSAPTPV